MVLDVILGIIVAASFSVGLLLYKLSKEEIDPLLSKISFKHLPLLAIVVAGLLGLVLAFSLQTQFSEHISIGVFASGIVLGSLALPHKDSHKMFKHAAETTIAFLVFFLGFLAFLRL